jgi:hypothetical protein
MDSILFCVPFVIFFALSHLDFPKTSSQEMCLSHIQVERVLAQASHEHQGKDFALGKVLWSPQMFLI